METNIESNCPARILLIEDNEGDVYLLSMALRQAEFPHTLTVIRDGADAMIFFRNAPASIDSLPDLILLDLNLPRVDGAALIELIRREPQLENTPVILLSSSRSPRDAALAQTLKRSTFMVKPSDLTAFLDIGREAKIFLQQSRGHGAWSAAR